MLGYQEFGLARRHAVAIARDRTGLLDEVAKNAALRYIDDALEVWKLGQADEDGTIAIEPVTGGLLGTFYPSEAGMTLADMARNKPKRVPVSRLRPENCAGPFIRTAADLWAMLWAQQWEPIAKAEKEIPLDLAMALLVERDGETMPVDSIASALRYLWISTWVSLRAYREETKELSSIIGERNERRRKQLSDLKIGRAITAKNKAERAAKLSLDLRAMAVDLFRADISKTNAQVATCLRQYREFAHLSHRGICDRIKGTQTEARRLLTRNPPK